jgi:lysophospholipase L1-like esterase
VALARFRELAAPAGEQARVVIRFRRHAAHLITGLLGACAPVVACSSNEPATRQVSFQPARDQRVPPAKIEPEEPPRPPSFVPIAIEDPSGIALEHFHQALRETEAGRKQTHVVMYGASHTAADIYPDVVRQRLQARFGDGGAGFIMPAKPIKYYSVPGIAFESSVGWTGYHVRTSTTAEDHFGLAGQYVSPSRRTARASFVTKAHGDLSGYASDLELYYWKQPGGGRFKVEIDGKTTELSATGKSGAAYKRWSLADDHHRVEISARGDHPLRLFGMSLERDQPGVVIDTLGIPGARASTQLMWNEALQREHLRKRHPDLVILAYGTNESGDDDQPIEDYAANLRKVIGRIKRAVPKASCVLVGPSDQPIRQEDGSYLDRPRTGQIVTTQRHVAAELGCGFFDLVSFMGGPLSMLEWCDGEPPFGAGDHVHFTSRGYQALGNVLHDALMAGYDAPALIGGSSGAEPERKAAPLESSDASVTEPIPAAAEDSEDTDEPEQLNAPQRSPQKPSSKPGSTYRR